MCSCLILGGGVIGLSLAWELARRGWRVRVVERGQPGRGTSWAGAGILPPAGRPAHATPEDDLRRLSYELHPEWAARLAAETGIDNGFRRSGGLYLARGAGEAAALRAAGEDWRREGIEVIPLDAAALQQREPALAAGGAGGGAAIRASLLLPGECQLRNPRHLKALVAACVKAGVEIEAETDVRQLVIAGDRVASVETTPNCWPGSPGATTAAPITSACWCWCVRPPTPSRSSPRASGTARF